MKTNTLLSVENLTIGFSEHNSIVPVVDHVSFTMEEGEIIGIVGESGSGKSMSSLAIMSLLPKDARVMEGKILFDGKDILTSSLEEQRALKGTHMAMIFQEPMTSFNPVLTVGAQVEEMLRLHETCDPTEYKNRTIAIMKEAGLLEAEDIYHKYPHQLSGGMRQRAMIAMAMIAGPKLLIADEPTTALDVTIQKKIIMLLKEINQRHGTAILFVSHDLGVITSICNRVLVMKDGRIVEQGIAKELFLNPKTEYTKMLIEAAPVTWMSQLMKPVKDSEDFDQEKNKDGVSVTEANRENALVSVENLNVYYREHGKRVFSSSKAKHVVKNASLQIIKGEVLGIVGESGSGKTTLAKAIAGLIRDTEGVVRWNYDGAIEGITRYNRPQMVFQDPYGSLNPSKRVDWILQEPLRIQGGYTKKERQAKVIEIIQQVGLSKEHLNRYMSQLSGGQRQRVAIAAALILNPELIILDEPVSALDVTIQAQILELLKHLQKKYHLSYLFISHDLNVVYQICNRICVMHEGEIIETRDRTEFFRNPDKEYSRLLLESTLPTEF
ncbi:ABC transporter ATP-binding protein [Lachnospiraceae bacterium MD1]|jgi:peptide/nickel transport system ATP-binding protein|uniref:ABC transporter ATP-binding protein n=1 Tax=Variimorphobacter saccharofermentans TaxID=2755051 RepID=A0A839JWM2_9FIRM|nr:ABC transporter ATP-binding protein [Variimorphobacter saccharofermentans]MBB2181644.1 ABC transporter ATP-binding protein [Variimorphobacter saccharofermentans]